MGCMGIFLLARLQKFHCLYLPFRLSISLSYGNKSFFSVLSTLSFCVRLRSLCLFVRPLKLRCLCRCQALPCLSKYCCRLTAHSR